MLIKFRLRYFTSSNNETFTTMTQIIIISFTCFLFGWFLPSPTKVIRCFKKAFYRVADFFCNICERIADDVEVY